MLTMGTMKSAGVDGCRWGKNATKNGVNLRNVSSGVRSVAINHCIDKGYSSGISLLRNLICQRISADQSLLALRDNDARNAYSKFNSPFYRTQNTTSFM